MVRVDVLTQYCKGCGLCIQVCPTGKFVISETLSAQGIFPVAARKEIACKLCFNCTVICPDAAIEIVEEQSAARKRKKRLRSHRKS